ncbi:MAG: SulP family inorganic anion transporter [Candidatus Eiseniibacteriota bacterium]|jgi:SulP family sulfate permease
MPYRIEQAGLGNATPSPLGQRLAEAWFQHLLQPVTILREYRRADLPADLLAGMTVAMVALPQAVAYAAIANLPPHYGLYSAIVAGSVGALWGSSRHLSTGPTNAASILVLSILAPIVALDSSAFLVAASILAVLVGGFRLLFGLARLGVLVNFVSRAVLLGFMAGAGVLIALNQLAPLLGIDRRPSTDPFTTVIGLWRRLGEAQPAAILFGVGAIVVTVAINRFSRKLPGSLIALVLATALVGWLGGAGAASAPGGGAVIGKGLARIAVIGEIPGAIPHPIDLGQAWAFLEGGTARQLFTGALAVALLGLVEAVSIARTLARETGQRLDVNQEFVGQGLASIAAGFLNGYACSGSFTRSAINYQSGARTQMSSVFTGLIILGGSLLAAPHLALLPRASVAGVIMLVANGMIDRAGIRRMLRTSREESAVMGITFAATLLFPLEFAVLSGVIFSLATYLYHASTPRVFPVVPDPTFRHLVEAGPESASCPQLAIMSIRGSLFFGATQHVEDRLLEHLAGHPDQHLLLLRMHGVDQCDFTGIECLETVVHAYREQEGDVYLVQVRPAVREIMQQSGFERFLGEDHFLDQEEAIDFLFEQRIDPARCWHDCTVRVFAECQALPKHLTDLDLPPDRHQPIEPWRALNVDEVETLVERDAACIVDVRQPEEFRTGHLHGARSVPLQHIMRGVDGLPGDRPILLVCRTGRRSRRALRILREFGFQDIRYLKGGILSWKAADRPVEVA